MVTQAGFGNHKWAMAVDVDKCTGCQACVLACQVENNIPLNTQDRFAFVRLTDLFQGDPNGTSLGADIDAIGAISSLMSSCV